MHDEFYKLVGDNVIAVGDLRKVEAPKELGFCKKKEDRLFSTDINIFGFKAVVSTIFMPIDHGPGLGDPVVFETMIFCEEIKDLNCKPFGRESSLTGARDNHNAAICFVTGYLKTHYNINKKRKKK